MEACRTSSSTQRRRRRANWKRGRPVGAGQRVDPVQHKHVEHEVPADGVSPAYNVVDLPREGLRRNLSMERSDLAHPGGFGEHGLEVVPDERFGQGRGGASRNPPPMLVSEIRTVSVWNTGGPSP
jgi:hypothetical protein